MIFYILKRNVHYIFPNGKKKKKKKKKIEPHSLFPQGIPLR